MKKKFIGIFICMLLIVTAVPITGQITKNILIKDNDEINPSINGEKWMKTFGGKDSDVGNSVLQTSDGGYIVCGDTRSFGSGYEDIWVIKTDYKGDLIWEKKFGGDRSENGNSIQQTSDGGYIIAGNTHSYGKAGDVWLIKIDSYGNKLWDKTYGGDESDVGYDVKQTSDGGFIIIGFTTSYGAGYGDFYLIKTDSEGNMLWEKTYGLEGDDRGTSVQQTPDGGFILTGWRTKFENTGVWLVKTNSEGEMTWDKGFTGPGVDRGHSVQITDDGGYIIVGEFEVYINDVPLFYHIWLIKTDSKGELLWENNFGAYGWYRGNSVQQTDDGGYIICGDGPNNVRLDALLIKTNSEGKEEWTRFYGGIGSDIALSVKQTNDGGYILSGFKASGLYNDLWLVKTDSTGNVPRNKAFNRSIPRSFEHFINLFPLLIRIYQRFAQ